MTSIKLICREGFNYSGWQRVFCLDGEVHVAKQVFEMMMKCEQLDLGELGFSPDDAGLYYGEGYGHQCLFVQGGESFTLEDFTECVRDATELEVTCEEPN